MGSSWSDLATSAADEERLEAELASAQEQAEQIAADFTLRWTGEAVRPEVAVDLDVGGDDQPLFVFSIRVELSDELPSADYPLDELDEFAASLRRELAGTKVDDWSWIVTFVTKAG